jgi:phosphatidylserine decarboxylase
MVRDGIPWVAFPVALAIVPMLFGLWWPAAALLLISVFMAFFFRDPRRKIPTEAGIVVAPADGRVTLVRHGESHLGTDSLVSIFLSPFDVHVNRAPIAGAISAIQYKKGKFRMATSEQARDVNEQNQLTIDGDNLRAECTQIAGILARRIVCWKREGDKVELGERFGMIKFGSRTDVRLPYAVEIVVKKGARVRGGVTIIGRIRQ